MFLATLGSSVSYAQSVQVPWAIPADVSIRAVNGYPMAFQDHGAGVAVVFVHGAMTDYRYWDYQSQVFSKDYRFLAPALRHYYPEKWDASSSDFSVEQHAEDVSTLIASLGLGKVHLVGHSRGGAIALHVARTHPEVVRTLTLVDPSGAETLLPKTPEGQQQAAELAALMVSVRSVYRAQGPEAASRHFVDTVNGRGAWDKRTQDERQRAIDNVGTVIGDPATRPPIDCEAVRAFDFPVLFLTGARSPKRYGDMLKAMRVCNPAIPEPIVVPNAGHTMSRENRTFFDETILTFIRSR